MVCVLCHLVIEVPIDFIIVSRSEVHHDMLVAKEKHGGARIKQLVHDVEIRHLANIDQIDHCEILDVFGETEKHFILTHAGLVVVVTETDHDDTILFAQDGLNTTHTAETHTQRHTAESIA